MWGQTALSVLLPAVCIASVSIPGVSGQKYDNEEMDLRHHFTDEKTWDQEGWSHLPKVKQKMGKLKFEPRQSGSPTCILSPHCSGNFSKVSLATHAFQ